MGALFLSQLDCLATDSRMLWLFRGAELNIFPIVSLLESCKKMEYFPLDALTFGRIRHPTRRGDEDDDDDDPLREFGNSYHATDVLHVVGTSSRCWVASDEYVRG